MQSSITGRNRSIRFLASLRERFEVGRGVHSGISFSLSPIRNKTETSRSARLSILHDNALSNHKRNQERSNGTQH